MKVTTIKWRRFLAPLVLVVAFVVACSTSTKTNGGLQLILATDLPTPEVFDAMTLEIRQEETPGVWGEPLIKREFLVPAEARLPTTFAVAAGETTRRRVRLVVVGKKSGTPLVLREVEIQVPADRVAGLPLVLAQKCVGKVEVDANGDARSTCPANESCQPDTGVCGPTEVDPSSLREYAIGDEDKLESTAEDAGNEPPKKTTKDITEFVINDVAGTIQGGDIAVTLPNGTPVVALAPIVRITGESVSPASGAPQDFTSPVKYEVRAEDGTIKAYTARVSLAPAAEPVGFNPPGGLFTSAQDVVLTTPTPNAKIFYTTDGTVPVPPGGFLYSGPIPVTTTTTINAVVTAPGHANSDVVTAVYTIDIPLGVTDPVTFAPPAGTYGNPLSVSLGTTTGSATICYTLDGTPPSCLAGNCEGASVKYVGASPLQVDAPLGGGTATIRAVACKAGNSNSELTQAVYAWRAFDVTASPPPGNVALNAPVTLSTQTVTSGANLVTIRYTTDGQSPTCISGQVINGSSGNVIVNADMTIRAIACRPHYQESNVSVFATYDVP